MLKRYSSLTSCITDDDSIARRQQNTAKMGLLTMLVRNDAMKNDPKEIYGWRVYALACSVRFPLPGASPHC